MATTLNYCEQPPWVLASREFNEDPKPIILQGDIAADRRFFDTLDNTACPSARAQLFADYVSVKFYLNEVDDQTCHARRALHRSYVRFLRGWGIDSNSPEGAALKGWVESRFGLPPTFHKQPIVGAHGAPYDRDYSPYELERTAGVARTNAIYCQFDLVYRYCQYELARRQPAQRWLTLFRGTHDASEHLITERIDRRNYYVRLNNLSSFTSEKERAWEFGSTVWRLQVPKVKVFFFGELLPAIHLQGENEYLVIGGEYRVTEIWE